MDSRAFLGLQATHNPFRWLLPVVPGLCTNANFLFGGCGLGAAISALEGTTQRECIWATGQYLSYARPGEVMDIDVTLAATGHQITQARAVCHVGNREILTVNASLGHRPMSHRAQFEMMPDVPRPLQCHQRIRLDAEGTINARFEQRLVKFRDWEGLDGSQPGDGRTILWSRIPEVIEGVDASALAILGDFVPMAVGQGLGLQGGGNSLDNTLRLGRLVPTQWVLLDIHVHMVERGFGHGLVHMYAEDGTLLAVASQTCILRLWDRTGQQAAAEPPVVGLAGGAA
jgi:acyl-CoA thioesterase